MTPLGIEWPHLLIFCVIFLFCPCFIYFIHFPNFPIFTLDCALVIFFTFFPIFTLAAAEKPQHSAEFIYEAFLTPKICCDPQGAFSVQKLAIFAQKIRVLTFFESTHQNCLKFGQKLGTVAIHYMWWHYMFLAVFGRFLPNSWCFLANFCYLNKVYGLVMVNEFLSSDEKIWAIFWTLFWSKNGPFMAKKKVFSGFLENRSSELHLTLPVT